MSLNSGETLQPFKPLNQLIYDSAGNLIGIQNDRANGSDLRIGGGRGVDGTFATLVATTALTLNAGATFNLYNTADQTTNYERLRADWSGNVARIYTDFGGTGTSRNLRVGVGAAGAPTTYIDFGRTALPFFSFVAASTAGTTTPFVNFGSALTSTANSGTTNIVGINPTINQSGTAGYTALDVNPTESSTGSGTKLLQRWAVGGAELARIGNNGYFYANGFSATNTSGFSFATGFGVTPDVTLNRDAADTLALRRSTNAQTFRVYKTFTDASNYERLDVTWAGSQCFIGAAYAGTGAGRELQFVSYGSAAFTLTATAHMALAAGTTARSQINFASSTAPTSPADGDLWFDGTNLKLRVSGATYTLTKT